MRRLIVDCDPGSDDAWALFCLLAAEKECNFKVIAITCVNGNSTVENCCRNALRVLHAANRLDIPVYRGASNPLIELETEAVENFHGGDGLCNVEHEYEPDMSLIQSESAVLAIKRLIDETQKDEQIDLIFIGPLTNLALLLKTFEGSCEKVNHIYIMGGSYTGLGNITRCAEWNFWCDPEAAFIVFRNANRPITLLPLESCRRMAVPIEWRHQEVGKIENSLTKMMNPIEIKAFEGFTNWIPYDGALAAYIIDPSIAKLQLPVHMSIELGGIYTRGQTVIDHRRGSKLKANVTIIDQLDVDKFKSLILKTVEYFNNKH